VRSTEDAWTSRSRLGRFLTRSALGFAAFALASSVAATPGPGRPLAATRLPEAWDEPTEVVLVTLDGSRFREIFEGVDPDLARRQHLPSERIVPAQQLMPRLQRLIAAGVALGAPGHGAAIRASGPEFVSLPGYSEIFSGRRVTGCRDNACAGSNVPSMVDQLVEQTHGLHSAAVVTSWPDIARVAATNPAVAVSAGRHAGATRARFASLASVKGALERAAPTAPWPGNGDFRRDRFTAEVALSYLESEHPSFLFVGLGETDEFGHQDNYAGYLDALVEADRYIGQLADVLAEHSRHGVRTALFVTADHGRSHDFRDHGAAHPESSRVWLVAAGSAIAARGLVAAGREHHLADIAPTVRELFGLRADHHENAGVSLLGSIGAGASGVGVPRAQGEHRGEHRGQRPRPSAERELAHK